MAPSRRMTIGGVPDVVCCLLLVWKSFLCRQVLADGRVRFAQQPQLKERHACFNTILEISCADETDNEILVFESARYGRNDTQVSEICHVPYTRNCDIDVQHPLSRACGGRRRCTLAINTAFFGDPCGYEEFLMITFRCVPVARIEQRCFASPSGDVDPASVATGPRTLFGTGYISSPNYPDRYYMDAECRWSVVVQQRQTVRLTILDFELDVRRAAICHDFLRVSYRARTSGGGGHTSGRSSDATAARAATSAVADGVAVVEVFKDCGSLGKQIVDVPANNVELWFRTGRSSLTQRGFILYFEAMGAGCDALSSQYDSRRQSVQYFVNHGFLFANSSCRPGFYFADVDRTVFQLHCRHTVWNDTLLQCSPVESIPAASPSSPSPVSSTRSPRSVGPPLKFTDQPETVLGFAVGILLLVLLTTLCILLVVFSRHRKYAVKCTGTSMAVRNLRENVINDAIHETILQQTPSRAPRLAAASGAAADDDWDDAYKDDLYRAVKKLRNATDTGQRARKRTGPRWQWRNILEWPPNDVGSADDDDDDEAVEVEYQLQQRPAFGGIYGRLLAIEAQTSPASTTTSACGVGCRQCCEERYGPHRPDLIPGRCAPPTVTSVIPPTASCDAATVVVVATTDETTVTSATPLVGGEVSPDAATSIDDELSVRTNC